MEQAITVTQLEAGVSLVPRSTADAGSGFHRRSRVLGVVETPPAQPGLRRVSVSCSSEARNASLEHLRALERAIVTVRDLSDEVVHGGDLYTPGLRELARNLAEDLFWKAKTLELLSARQGMSGPPGLA